MTEKRRDKLLKEAREQYKKSQKEKLDLKPLFKFSIFLIISLIALKILPNTLEFEFILMLVYSFPLVTLTIVILVLVLAYLFNRI